jgi:hypothetical protein
VRWPAGGREGAPEDSRGPKKQNVQSNAGHKDQVPIQRAASRYLGKGQKVEAFKPLYLGCRLRGIVLVVVNMLGVRGLNEMRSKKRTVD